MASTSPEAPRSLFTSGIATPSISIGSASRFSKSPWNWLASSKPKGFPSLPAEQEAATCSRRRRAGRTPFRFGLRLGPDQRYRPMEPDDQDRFLSQTTGLLFAAAPQDDGIDLFDAQTGERLLTSDEEEAGRRLA